MRKSLKNIISVEILIKTKGKKGNLQNGIMVILWKDEGQNGNFTLILEKVMKGEMKKILEKEKKKKKRKILERGMCPSHACYVYIYIDGIHLFNEEKRKKEREKKKKEEKQKKRGARLRGWPNQPHMVILRS